MTPPPPAQISYTYKCASAKLLETVCDNIDGFETIVSLMLIQTISSSIEFEDINDIDAKYPQLINFKQTVFFARTPRHIRIETSLLSLSILSYLTPKRPDIVKMIENLFITHSAFFFNPQLTSKAGTSLLTPFNDPLGLLKARICMVLGYYMDSLFKSNKSAIHAPLHYLLTCLTLKGEVTSNNYFTCVTD